MELVEGVTLFRHLSRTKGGLPLAETMTIATSVADALAVAHRHALVHRDIKPGNIMIGSLGAKLLTSVWPNRRRAPMMRRAA